MMTLGITGRSGCGKSTVTAVFAARGIPLADADQLSREILLPGSPLLPQLAERFGADIIKEDGTLDRRLLADRAFATPEGKAALDALTHPEIVRRIRAAKQAAQQAGAKLFVLDGAVIMARQQRPSATSSVWSRHRLKSAWSASRPGTASRLRWPPAASTPRRRRLC